MRRSLSVGLVLALLTAGCSHASPAPTAAPTTEVTTAAPSLVIDDPPGALACHLLVVAITDGTLMEPGTVDGIVTASAPADAPLVDSARRLATAYASAMAAKGTADEPDTVAAVSEAGADLTGVCEDSGLETAG